MQGIKYNMHIMGHLHGILKQKTKRKIHFYHKSAIKRHRNAYHVTDMMINIFKKHVKKILRIRK